ncbi:MAG: hypothetical protein U0893_12020 [Chloroflexota bacterium]
MTHVGGAFLLGAFLLMASQARPPGLTRCGAPPDALAHQPFATPRSWRRWSASPPRPDPLHVWLPRLAAPSYASALMSA